MLFSVINGVKELAVESWKNSECEMFGQEAT